ncbi:MAG: ZIP family metal transporter [Cyanobacteria bacterium]|jgi:ZIP family zinc transporter|nr:ZIP family metal transporter [Cyanobacteria bacterium GSL.Bin21]
MSPIIAGFIASFCAGMATVVGALPVLVPMKYTRRAQGMMLGFGGGVMLAASAFSLIIPGTQAAIAQGSTQMQAALIMAMGLGLGAIFLKVTHDLLPHEHFFKGFEGRDGRNLKRIWLFVFAITLHNFPEGLAVGVNFASGDYSQGLPLAIGIGLQNLPEGLVVALSLVGQNYTALSALGISLMTGLVEPIGGLIGVGVFALAQSLLPWGMAFAAGAMLFVISDDIIPESHEKGRENEGTIGIMVGFIVMMVLDIGLS